MASSGFRPPQFSEDFAWLPSWLQPYQKPILEENNESSESLSQFSGKHHLYRQKSNFEARERPLCSKDDSEYSSFHLFLSGESCPIATDTSSCGNVLSFHLHLSSRSVTQTAIPVHDSLQRGGREKNICQAVSIMPVVQTDKVDTLPQTDLPKSIAKSFAQSLGRNNKKNHQKKFWDAIELSIAATEALAISELVNNGPSEVFCASSIIEIALRVKQARKQHCLSVLDDVSACTLEEIDETDELDELYKISMEDEYIDVGLQMPSGADSDSDFVDSKSNLLKLSANSFSSYVMQEGSSYANGSFVPNTQLPESHNFREEFEHQDMDYLDCLQNKSDDKISLPKQSEKLQLTSSTLQPRDLCDKLPSDVDALRRIIDMTPCPHKSVLRTPEVIAALDNTPSRKETSTKATIRNEDNTANKGGMAIIHIEADTLSAPDHCDSEKADAGNKVNSVAGERFRSRWLGGWTGKVTSANDTRTNVEEAWNITNNIPRFLLEKVSFLSESVDLATEDDSVHKAEAELTIHDLHLITKETLPSQDVVGSSNFSSVDPLCSIVPCSISTENSNDSYVAQVSHQKSLGDVLENCLNSTGRYLGVEGLDTSMVTISTPMIRPVLVPCKEDRSALKTSGQTFKEVKRKRLASLRSYSMLGPAQSTGLRDMFHQNEALLKCATEGTTVLPPLDTGFASSRDEGSKPVFENQQSAGSKKIDKVEDNCYREMHNTYPRKPNLNQSRLRKADRELGNEKRCEPLVLNYGCRRRLHAGKYILNDTREENLEGAMMQQKRHRLENANSTARCPVQPNVVTTTSILSCLRPTTFIQSRTKKTVQFAEKESSVHHYNTENRQLSVQQRCPIGKRGKDCGIKSRSNIWEGSNYLTSCLLNSRKRLILQGFKFLLTGYTTQKERELEMLIRRHGGIVLDDFPSPLPNIKGGKRSKFKKQDVPFVLSPNKIQTTKFLYGCAVNALLLRTDWLTDSVKAGCVLSPNNYLILLHQEAKCKRMRRIGQVIHRLSCHTIFDGVGIMLYGKPSFCTTFIKIIKHGGGRVFKTLHWLVQSLNNGRISLGAVILEDDGSPSRHLKQCVLEHKLQLLPVSWLINSLHSGKLIGENISPLGRNIESPQDLYLSEEI